MAIDTVSELVQVLGKYRFLEPAQFEELTLHLQLQFPEPRVLAKELLQRGWLTPYQVNQVLQGRADSLVLEKYILIEKLSEGAVGELFKARHQHMRRTVALQVVRGDLLSQPGAVERFYEEVQSVSSLSHPHLVASYDAGPIGVTHFFAMELVDGIDLARQVQQSGPLSIEQACSAVYQACLGLQHAADRGLLHHDLRPANLLWGRAGVVKVRNLGLTLIRQHTRHTKLKAPTSSDSQKSLIADYRSPEQGSSAVAPDVRAELYSLGCTFHFLLTGQPPFPGGGVEEKLHRHQNEPAAPIETLREDVPPEVSEVIARLLAKDPAERYQSPAELAAALAALPWTGDDPAASSTASLSGIQTPTATPRPKGALIPRGRNFAVIAAGAGLAVAILVLLVFIFRSSPGQTSHTDAGPVVAKISMPRPHAPALIVQCGKGGGKLEDEHLAPGYSVKRHQGEHYDGWPKELARTHCWAHGGIIRFDVNLPQPTAGIVRMHLFDPEKVRKEKVVVQGNVAGTFDNFGPPGIWVDVPVTAADTKSGKVEVFIENQNKGVNAVVSTVQFVPTTPATPVLPAELVVHCGKGSGKNQDQVIKRGYGYKLHQGVAREPWPAGSSRTHCWEDRDQVRFDVSVPPGIAGVLRLTLADPERVNPNQRVLVLGRVVGEGVPFVKTEKQVLAALSEADTKDGKIDVVIKSLPPSQAAVISVIEFFPWPP